MCDAPPGFADGGPPRNNRRFFLGIMGVTDMERKLLGEETKTAPAEECLD